MQTTTGRPSSFEKFGGAYTSISKYGLSTSLYFKFVCTATLSIPGSR